MRRAPVLGKEWAQLGDSLVNFVVSAALSMATGRPCGVKVKDRVLREACRRAGLNLMVKRMPGLKDEDLAEAILGYMWAKGLMSVDEMVEVCFREAAKNPSEERVVERLLAEAARVLANKL